MSKVAMRLNARSTAAGSRAASRDRPFDIYLAVPLAGCLYALIVYPLLLSGCSPADQVCLMAPRPENRVVWPLLASAAVVMVVMNWRRIALSPNIMCLFAYLAFAGASVAWAYHTESSAVRYVQQVMVVTSIVLPAMIMTGRTDLVRALFLCFAIASLLSIFFVLGPPPRLAENATPGHTGFFAGKNYLGQCAAITLLLSFNEMRYRGVRRVFGAIVGAVAVGLLVLSNSKTGAALVVLTPALAGIAILGRRMFGFSPVVLPVAILAIYTVMTFLTSIDVYRLSYYMYGESTFTGRKFIWEFAQYEISMRPWLGWGYQSFWLVPNSPSAEAKGFVKAMPNAHSGYYDSLLEMGRFGFVLLIAYLTMTLHACQRMIDRDPGRAWCVLSLVVFVLIGNALETTFMRGFEFLWILFLFLTAEIGRQWVWARAEAPARANVRMRSAVTRSPYRRPSGGRFGHQAGVRSQ